MFKVTLYVFSIKILYILKMSCYLNLGTLIFTNIR